VLVAATILGTVGQAGEEIGWRGYLLPRLAERAGLVGASLIVGAIWAMWHLPLFFAAGADTYHQSFPLYALQITAYSVALAWLYWRTGGSLLLAMFMHSAFNNMKDIVPSGVTQGGSVFTFDSTLVLRLTVLLLWIIGALLLVRMRGVRQVGEAPVRHLSLPTA
jgi:membrane protease YdiL (CAAX protease family)